MFGDTLWYLVLVHHEGLLRAWVRVASSKWDLHLLLKVLQATTNPEALQNRLSVGVFLIPW